MMMMTTWRANIENDTRSNNVADITHHAWFPSRRQWTSTLPNDQTHTKSRRSRSKTAAENVHWPSSFHVLDVSSFHPTSNFVCFSPVSSSSLAYDICSLPMEGSFLTRSLLSLSRSAQCERSAQALIRCSQPFLFPLRFVENEEEDCVSIFFPSLSLSAPMLPHTHRARERCDCC